MEVSGAISSSANYYFLCGTVRADKRWRDTTLHTLAPFPYRIPYVPPFAQQRGNIYCGTTRSAPLCDEEDASPLALGPGKNRGQPERKWKSEEPGHGQMDIQQ